MSRGESENVLYEEDIEASVGESPSWAMRLLTAFPAFRSRNYQLYFSGQLVSLVGTWLQVVAEGWLVLQLTNSAFLIGLVTALAMLPSLLFSLLGGVIIDRFPTKTILLFTQYAAMLLALMYGLLTITHHITIYEILILAFLLGTVSAVDIPARQAFVVDLVDKADLPSAIALNSGMFNAARVVGPGVAGILIAYVGSGGAFLLNGISYTAAICALYAMQVVHISRHSHQHPFTAIKEGVAYAFSHPVIRTLLLFTGIASVFGWSYSAIMPFIAKNQFHLDAKGLGYLYAASGLGALIGSILISVFSKKIKPIAFIIGGSIVFTLFLIGFSATHVVELGLICLFFAGIGLLTQFSTMNTLLQQMVEDRMRGRVMSLYSLMFLGLAPLGNFEVGFVAQYLGPSLAIQIGAGIVLVCSVGLFFIRNTIRTQQQAYDKANS